MVHVNAFRVATNTEVLETARENRFADKLLAFDFSASR